MLLLNFIVQTKPLRSNWYFNTSYVVIKQKAEENRNERIKKFQYILCCY